MKKLIFSTAAAALLFSSCKKDDDFSSREEALTSGKWRITAHTTSFSINGEKQTKDRFAEYRDCEKATLISFPRQVDSAIQYVQGNVQCAPGSTPSGWYPSYSNFRLIKDESVLRYLSSQGNAYDFTIDYMDKNVIKTSYRNAAYLDGGIHSEEVNINYERVD